MLCGTENSVSSLALCGGKQQQFYVYEMWVENINNPISRLMYYWGGGVHTNNYQ